MTAPKRIFGASDIAAMFGVTRGCVSNWASRYENVPEPDFVHLTDKVERNYYLESTIQEWLEWHRTTMSASRSAAARARKTTTNTDPKGN